MQTMKPFSSMLYDSIVFASWRILPNSPVRTCSRTCLRALRNRDEELTGVDQLLLRNLPAFIGLDLALELANL